MCLYTRQSSAKIVGVADGGKLSVKIKKSGPKSVPWETLLLMGTSNYLRALRYYVLFVFLKGNFIIINHFSKRNCIISTIRSI